MGSKYEDTCSPELQNLSDITNASFPPKGIMEMAKKLFITLNFSLTVPTVLSFLMPLLHSRDPGDRITTNLALYYAQVSLTISALVVQVPSLLASACIYLARCSTSYIVWDSMESTLTGYDCNTVHAMTLQLRAHLAVQHTSSSNYHTHGRYKRRQYGQVSEKPLPTVKRIMELHSQCDPDGF